LIQEQSKTDWKEMYQVLTVDTVWKYTFLKQLQDIIAISKSFHVDAQIVEG
jgi:phosphoribosylformylglycinamidine cyclo-ligase